jgi:hypothetical protein
MDEQIGAMPATITAMPISDAKFVQATIGRGQRMHYRLSQDLPHGRLKNGGVDKDNSTTDHS